MSVYQKLSNVRAVVAKSDIKKSGVNKYAGYAYFELGDFMPITLAECAKEKICGIFGLNNGLATLTIVNDEDVSDRIEFSVPWVSAPANKQTTEIQLLGSTITYLRRYLWVMALELTENDFVDASEPPRTEQRKQRSKADEMKSKVGVPVEPQPLFSVDDIKKEIEEMTLSTVCDVFIKCTQLGEDGKNAVRKLYIDKKNQLSKNATFEEISGLIQNAKNENELSLANSLIKFMNPEQQNTLCQMYQSKITA